jgi:hypothetical protein
MTTRENHNAIFLNHEFKIVEHFHYSRISGLLRASQGNKSTRYLTFCKLVNAWFRFSSVAASPGFNSRTLSKSFIAKGKERVCT